MQPYDRSKEKPEFLSFSLGKIFFFLFLSLSSSLLLDDFGAFQFSHAFHQSWLIIAEEPVNLRLEDHAGTIQPSAQTHASQKFIGCLSVSRINFVVRLMLMIKKVIKAGHMSSVFRGGEKQWVMKVEIPSRDWRSEEAPTTDEDRVFRLVDAYPLSSNTIDDDRGIVDPSDYWCSWPDLAMFMCCLIEASPFSAAKKQSSPDFDRIFSSQWCHNTHASDIAMRICIYGSKDSEQLRVILDIGMNMGVGYSDTGYWGIWEI